MTTRSDQATHAHRVPDRTTAWTALITLYILWGTTYLAIDEMIGSIPPLIGAGSRFVVAGGSLLLFRLWRTKRWPTRENWIGAAVIGIFLILGGNAFVALSEQSVPTGIVALVIALVPIWLALIDRVVLRNSPASWRTVVGLVAGFIGAALLVGTSMGGDISASGLGLAVAASLLWSVGTVYARHARLPDDALTGSAMQQLVGGVVTMAIGTALGDWNGFSLTDVTRSSMLGWIYLVIFGSWIGFTCYLWLVRNVRTSLVSTYAYVNPVVAVTLGIVVLNETLGPRQLIAGGVILASVALIVSSGGVGRTDSPR